MSEPDGPCSTMKHFSKSHNSKVNKYIKYSKESESLLYSYKKKILLHTIMHPINFSVYGMTKLNLNHYLWLCFQRSKNSNKKMNLNLKKFTLQSLIEWTCYTLRVYSKIAGSMAHPPPTPTLVTLKSPYILVPLQTLLLLEIYTELIF